VIRRLATLVLLAAALAVHLHGLQPFLGATGQDFDAIHFYLPLAKRLAAEGWSFFLVEASVQAPPLAFAWPALLGADLETIKAANAFLSCVLLVLVYRTATLWHSQAAGILAAFAYAASPLFKPYLPTALTEPPFLFFMAVWIWGLSEWRFRDRLAYLYVAGVALGLALLTRATLFYGLLLFLPFLLRSRHALAAHAIAAALPLAFLAKNLLVFGFPFYATGAGNALYLGTSPLFRGYDAGYLNLVFDVGAVTGTAAPLTLRSDALLMAAAKVLIASMDPRDLAAMYAQKLAAFLFVTNAETVGNVLGLRVWRIATLVLAAAGLAGLRDRWLAWLVGALLAYQIAVHVPVLYNHRYSVGALDLWLTLLAGVGVAHLLARRRAIEIAAAGLAIAGGTAAAAHHAWSGRMPEPDVFAAEHVLVWESRTVPAEVDIRGEPNYSPWFNHVLVIDGKGCRAHQIGMREPRMRLEIPCNSVDRVAIYSARGALALRRKLETSSGR
jgi:hypothetical protein